MAQIQSPSMGRDGAHLVSWLRKELIESIHSAQLTGVNKRGFEGSLVFPWMDEPMFSAVRIALESMK